MHYDEQFYEEMEWSCETSSSSIQPWIDDIDSVELLLKSFKNKDEVHYESIEQLECAPTLVLKK